MASTGIEGFRNVYDVLTAVSSGEKARLRRAARKIRLVLMCADNTSLNEEHRACLTALLGLLVPDWNEAEKLRLEAAQSYLQVRGKAALCCKNAVARVDENLRHYLLDQLTNQQKRNMPHGCCLQTIKVCNEREARRGLQDLGLGYRYPLLKMYPERAFDHSHSKAILEGRAMEQKFNGFVHVENAHLLDFLFDGYFDALIRHHEMDSLDDFDPDLDDTPVLRLPSTDIQTIAPEPKFMSSEEMERKKAKNKKRNQRKRAAELTKKKENAANVSAAGSTPDPEAKLSTSMALVSIGAPNSAMYEDKGPPRVKFVPKPIDKEWMDHSCLKSDTCTKFFTTLAEAMLQVPTANLERRVYGSQT
ncbi:hypothetical protein E4T47_07070 [Aureobasidium subglaciale]|nr:hypothetical protein E4T47_07070 [Aureobasidium subglaciale]